MTISRHSPHPNSTASAEAITELTLILFRVHGVLLQWGDRLVEPLGLTSARWQMLGAISLAGQPLTAPQIAAVMGVTRQGAQKQLNLLLESALVTSGANPAHRRSPLYALTSSGEKLYREAETLWVSKAVELAAKITPTQLQTTTTTLGAMLNHLSLQNPLKDSI